MFILSQTKKAFPCPGAHLLSRNRTTIGPVRLNFRVRDGNGCDPPGNGTKTRELFFNNMLQYFSELTMVVETSLAY